MDVSARESRARICIDCLGFRGLNSWRDIGFLASYIQMYAATIFWVSTMCATFVSLPLRDISSSTPPRAQNGSAWGDRRLPR
jgi:hypothetical protein